MAFQVNMRFAAPLAVLVVSGELDISTEHHLVWGVEQAIEQQCAVVAVDLSGVPFIDCSAIGTLVGAVHRLRGVSGQLMVTAVSPQVARLLELTGTAGLFGVRDGATTVVSLQPV